MKLDRYEKTKTLRRFFAEFSNELQKTKKMMQKASSYEKHLKNECRIFLKKILDDCYKIDKRGIKRRLWKYMNQITVISREIETFEKVKKNKLDKKVKINWFLTVYERLFELTLKFLTEYSYIIAKNKYKKEKSCQRFVDKYDYLTKKGQSIRKKQLEIFLEDAGYWKYGANCKVLEGKLRNSISHFNTFPSKNKIKVNNRWMTVEDLKNEYEQLASFYSFLLSESLKKTNWFQFVKNMEKFLKQNIETKRIPRLVNGCKKLLKLKK